MKQTSRRDFLLTSSFALESLTSHANETRVKEHAMHAFAAETRRRILCVGAHPGDPEFGCGGSLLKYSSAGHHVTVLYLTRGEASDPRVSYEAMAKLRTKEAEASCRILKVTASFAGQIDGNSEYNNDTASRFTAQILDAKPDVVFTHWPLDTHKDHQVAGLLTLNAWTNGGRPFQLYFYEVNTGAESMGFVPTDYEDITAQRETKKAALMEHRSQNPGEVYDRYFRSMEEFRGLEAGVLAAEAFVHFRTKDARARAL